MYIASIDCGTTNSRVYIIDSQGVIKGKGTRRVGVRDTAMTGSKNALRNGLIEALQEALLQANLEIDQIAFAISAGMITSEIGLLEVPHIQTPAGKHELAQHILFSQDETVFPVDFPIYFIPGIRNRFCSDTTTAEDVGLLDFMRGEEAQVIGYLEGVVQEGPSIVVILSSHTKFIAVSAEGKILQSITSLSGQVFEAVKKETFIGKSIEPCEGVPIPENYHDTKVIENAFNWQQKSGFVRSLLMIRFLDVLLHTQWYERRLFLESLIAAEDITAFNQMECAHDTSKRIVFIGPKERSDVYSYVFEHKLGWSRELLHSINDTTLIDMLNIKGSLAIARTAGLLP